MARRIRRKRNPRNSKGRFVRRARANPVKRRRARRNPKAKVVVKRRRRRAAKAAVKPVTRRRRRRASKAKVVVKRRRRRASKAKVATKRRRRRVRSNPIKRRRRRHARANPIKRRRRRLRRNPGKAIVRHRKRRYVRRSKGLASVAVYRRKIKKAGKRRSLRRSIARVQYQRASVVRRAGNKSVVAKAMHLKMNPGLSGLVVAAKTILPQAGVGAVSMVGLGFLGKEVSARLAPHLTFVPVSVAPFVPAISTAALSVGAYLLADKFAPKYKGAVVIGGLLGAVIQAVVAAAASGAPDGLAAKAKSALVGDYTTVGANYASGGMFREIGEYSTVGGQDDATEFAHDSLRGLDDATEFAPGEGGVLGGGMFRGSSR